MTDTIRDQAIEAAAKVWFQKMYGDGYDDPENWTARAVARDFTRPLVDAVLAVAFNRPDDAPHGPTLAALDRGLDHEHASWIDSARSEPDDPDDDSEQQFASTVAACLAAVSQAVGMAMIEREGW